jgi:hypothetical protein
VQPLSGVHRAADKWSLVVTLRPLPSELNRIRQRLEGGRGADSEDTRRTLQALKILRAVGVDQPNPDVLRGMNAVRTIDPAVLARISRMLVELRRAEVDELLKAQQEILDAFGQETWGAVRPPGRADIPDGWRAVPGVTIPHHPDAAVLRSERREAVPPTRRGPAGGGSAEAGERHTVSAMLVPSPRGPVAGPAAGALRSRISVATLMAWAIEKNLQKENAAKVLALLERLRVEPSQISPADFATWAPTRVAHMAALVDGFQDRIAAEPVGFLHLERIRFTPAGIERGELVYSLPLAPGESVNIAHKEWSNTSEEFSKIVTDYMEAFSEEGVSEKSEIAEAASSESQHSTGLDASVTATGSYGSVSVTASLGYNVSDSASQSEQFSRNQSIDLTRKASSRTRREHKMSFKVASAAGTEDQAVRTITNPFPDRATRLDYYQLIRKWRVELYRYGIRLTYDLTIPEPGSDILSRLQEVKAINAALEEGFGAPDATLPWMRFDLVPDDFTRQNYLAFAAQYNAVVEPPPDEYKWIDRAATHQWPTKDQAHLSQYFLLQVDVDDEYEVVQATRHYDLRFWPGEDWSITVEDVNDFLGKSGGLVMGYRTRYLVTFFIELKLTLRLRDEAYRRWKLKAWSAIREAAQTRYYEMRQMLKERLARLVEALGAEDALSLRKIEREEVMKGVVRWLFGPGFEFVPPGLPESLYGPDSAVVSEETWSRVLSHGKLTTFLHHAVEWENMLYFLYPYFWSHASRWEFKKYLDHPDAMHRAFLKAGSARVVLTIRPGFERDFVTLLENGADEPLPDTHPYLRITEEMENYAETNYPGIPPANPEDAEGRERGQLIGVWHEYTPTSALDITFDEPMPEA